MKFGEFAYCAPDSIGRCLEQLAQDDAVVLAGGQSLLPLMALRLAEPTLLVDIGAVPELREVVADPEQGSLRVGATVTQAELEDRPDLGELNPVLASALPFIGHRAIRNRGTVGGSVAHADPAAEWPALCVALDAEIELRGPGGARQLPAGDFFEGSFRTARSDDELVTHVRLPLLRSNQHGMVREAARRHGDFATVGCVVVLTADGQALEQAAVALFGGVSRPTRLADLEAALPGAAPDGWGGLVRDAVAGVRFQDDVHASGELRRHVAVNLVTEALRSAWEELR